MLFQEKIDNFMKNKNKISKVIKLIIYKLKIQIK